MGSYLSTKQKRNKNTYARTSHPAISCAKIQIWELSKFKCHLDMKTWFFLLPEYFWKNYKICIYGHFICCCYTSQFWLPKAYFFVFCKYLIVGWQSRTLDLPKKPLKLGTQKEKLFVGVCSTYLVCTTILSKVLI